MWTNWPRSHHCAPARHVRPGTRDQVAAAVAAAGEVRVAGRGHSFTAAPLTGDTLLSLDRLDRVLDIDAASGLVRVEAGITLHALSLELEARGLALPNLGDIAAQTLGGALATGTHGTGLRHPNLSAGVTGLELVLAGGEERTLTEADGDLLRAARVGLGTLGAVVAVTLRCVPAFALHGADGPEPLEDVLADLQARAECHDHFEFWAFPHTDVALTRTNTRVASAPAPPSRLRDWIDEVLLDNAAFGLMCRAGRRRPAAIPRLNRVVAAAIRRRERVDRSFRVFASRRLVRFTEMEYALPRARAEEAVRAAKAILERHPVSFPLELRFAAADDALLSPAHGRDTAYLAVHAYEGMPWEAPFREVEALLAGYSGRPHWGKRSFLTAAELAPRYPGWARWQAAREELDPGGVFTNAWAERVLGPAQRNARPSPR